MKNTHEQLFEEHFYNKYSENKQCRTVELKIYGQSSGTVEQMGLAKHFNSMVKKFKTRLEFWDRNDMLNT